MPRPRDIDTAEGRQRHEAKYQKILDAALEIFAHKGYHEAKISEIAKIAGVADGTIYLYFKNKDDLLISLFEAKIELLTAGLRREISDLPDPATRFRAIVLYHLRLAIEQPTLAAFITIELRTSAKFMKNYAKSQISEYMDQWGEVLEAGQSSGVFLPETSIMVVKQTLFGALDQIVVNWLHSRSKNPEQLLRMGEDLANFMLRAICVNPVQSPSVQPTHFDAAASAGKAQNADASAMPSLGMSAS